MQLTTVDNSETALSDREKNIFHPKVIRYYWKLSCYWKLLSIVMVMILPTTLKIHYIGGYKIWQKGGKLFIFLK